MSCYHFQKVYTNNVKWLEFAMRMENIQDLPYAVGSYLSDDQKDEVIEYCENDLDATEAFFYKSIKQLSLRKEYSKIESCNLLNSSEIHLSKEIFSKALAKEMGLSQWEVKQLRTERDIVPIKDVIFGYINFNDPVNQETLREFESRIWESKKINNSPFKKADEDDSQITFQVKYKNVIREYAEGGLHSFGKPGIYESDEDWVLIDVDFKAESRNLEIG